MKSPEAVWSGLSDRDRRALRWGALLLAPALLWALAVSPWLDAVQDRRDRLEARRTLHRAELDLLASADAYPAAVRTGARRLARAAPRLLEGPGEGVAAAALTQLVEDRVRAARVHLTGTTPRPPTRVDADLLALPLEVTGESDLRGILAFLEGLERGGGKLLRAGDVRIRSRRAGRSGEAETLTFRVLVTGYMLAPGEGGGAAGATDRSTPVAGGAAGSPQRPGGDAGRSAAGPEAVSSAGAPAGPGTGGRP